MAAMLANLSHGGDRKSDQAANLPDSPPTVTQQTAAEMLNVSERLVRAAKRVQRGRVPALIEAVEPGAAGSFQGSFQPCPEAG